MKNPIEMVVFDMAGTTIQDKNEVENCFIRASELTGLEVKREKIISMMGWSKILVFETLWRERLIGKDEETIQKQISFSYDTFRQILEEHYQTHEVLPSRGSNEIFLFLKDHKVKVVLNTGFYRKVTDIILEKTGWLNVASKKHRLVDFTVCSDEVQAGRPSPFMIFRAMQEFDISNVRKVIKIGDTPSDLAEGKNAGCLYSFGILGGTHTKQELMHYENDGVMKNLAHFQDFLEEKFYL